MLDVSYFYKVYDPDWFLIKIFLLSFTQIVFKNDKTRGHQLNSSVGQMLSVNSFWNPRVFSFPEGKLKMDKRQA